MTRKNMMLIAISYCIRNTPKSIHTHTISNPKNGQMNFMFYGLIISASISYLLDDIECEMDCLSSSEGVINEYTFLMVYCLLSHSVYTFLVFYIRYTCSIHSVMDRIISDLFSLHLLQHCVMTSKLQLIWPCTECGSEVEIVWQLHEPKQQPQQPRLTGTHLFIPLFHIPLYSHYLF